MNSLRKEPERYKKNIQVRRTPRAEGAGECDMFRQSWACSRKCEMKLERQVDSLIIFDILKCPWKMSTCRFSLGILLTRQYYFQSIFSTRSPLHRTISLSFQAAPWTSIFLLVSTFYAVGSLCLISSIWSGTLSIFFFSMSRQCFHSAPEF